MSSVDPRWSPPPEALRQRPHPVAYAFAIVMPLVLLAFLAAPLGLVWGLDRLRQGQQPTAVQPVSTDGEPGLGDPYYPGAGNGGYQVSKYVIDLSWDVPTQTITSTATIYARATQTLRSFSVDLALRTDKVVVDGQPAVFDSNGFSDVRITPADVIAAGTDFRVQVDYSGKPGDLRQGRVAPWRSTNQEWTVAGEPESSAWWFPANDHPSDPALMDVSIRVPAGMEAISVGRLESRDSRHEVDFDTWHWIARQPMATYLNFVSIGQYEIKEGTDRGLPYVYAVSEQLSAEQRAQAFAALLTSAARIQTLESMFGPYPFTELGGVVPVHQLGFGGLETQTRPVYNAGSILDPDFAPQLVTHELAHMWFGDNVTLRQWDDVFNSEAYASWTQWGYDERTGGAPANSALNATFDRFRDDDEFWRITMIDPTREHLFDAVYERGPMALQALRNVIGDDAFFRLARGWAQDPGSRSVEDWMTRAQTETPIDLGPFFQAWIHAPSAPERTEANGFRP